MAEEAVLIIDTYANFINDDQRPYQECMMEGRLWPR